MTELFTIPESKSPRLMWMERHGIETSDDPITNGWMAHGNKEGVGFGATENEAILNYARHAELKLWNEE